MKVLVAWEIEGHVFEAGVAQTQEEIEATFALRFKGYVTYNKTVKLEDLDPEDRVRGWERDAYDDEDAIYLLATHNGEPVGTFRLLECHKRYILADTGPGDEEFIFPERHPRDKGALHREDVVEGTRWVAFPVILPNKTIVNVKILVMAAVMQACFELNKKFLIGDVDTKALEKLGRSGWAYDLLSEKVFDRFGVPVRLVIYDVRTDYPTPMTIHR